MISILNSTYSIYSNKHRVEYLLDTKQDLSLLPSDICAGSTALVCENNAKYILNNSRIWVNLSSNMDISVELDDILKPNTRYQLGVLTKDITLTLPETASSDIEVDFAIADTTYNVNCDYLSLTVVADTHYQIIFSYDKALSTWFASVVSSDYVSNATAEVSTDETS